MSNITREHFARRLVSLFERFDHPDFDVEKYSELIMDIFLIFGSNTPDNERAYNMIEFGHAQGKSNPYIENYGFKLKDKAIFVSQVVNTLEGIPMPDEVVQAFPDLTQEEYEAIMRLATMLVMAFQPFRRR